jgi:RHS repeat-associated protein
MRETFEPSTRHRPVRANGQISAIAGVATYSYDGNAKRIKTVKAATTEYTMYSYAGAMTFVEKGSEMTDQLSLNSQVLVELKRAAGMTTPTYLHPDVLGSPRTATNASKNVLWSEIYDPFGVKLNGVPDKVGYTGHAHDQETNYTYMEARFYDAQVGRFLSTDPVDDEFNLYGYVRNDPFNLTDPSGMAPPGCGDGDCAQTAWQEVWQSIAALADGISTTADAFQGLSAARGLDDLPAFGQRATDSFNAFDTAIKIGKVGNATDVVAIAALAVAGDARSAVGTSIDSGIGVVGGAAVGFAGGGPLGAVLVGSAVGFGADQLEVGDGVIEWLDQMPELHPEVPYN